MLVAGLVLAFAQGSQAQGGVFTVNCAPLTVFRGDPIVSPGALSSHVHAVVGGTAFQLSLSNEQARNSKATTCDKVLDNSNYWQPQLYHQRRDGKFEVVEMEGIVSLSTSSPAILCIVVIDTQISFIGCLLYRPSV